MYTLHDETKHFTMTVPNVNHANVLKNARHNREVTYQLVLYFNCIILWNLEKIPQLSFNYNFSCIVAMRIDQYDCIELYRFVKHLSVKDNASNICFWFRDLILSDKDDETLTLKHDNVLLMVVFEESDTPLERVSNLVTQLFVSF